MVSKQFSLKIVFSTYAIPIILEPRNQVSDKVTCDRISLRVILIMKLFKLFHKEIPDFLTALFAVLLFIIT